MLTIPAVYFAGFDLMGLVIYLCVLCILFQLLSPPPVPAVTPLLAEQFAWELQRYPQRPQVEFVLDGICQGV